MEKQREMSVILFQLETFESVAGTIAGEKVLQAFYEVARKQLRPYHQIGRIAEGEFVVILPEVNESEVDIIARRIVADLSQIIVDDEPMVTRFGRASAQGASTDDLLQRRTIICMNHERLSPHMTRPQVKFRSRRSRCIGGRRCLRSRLGARRARREPVLVLVHGDECANTPYSALQTESPRAHR